MDKIFPNYINHMRHTTVVPAQLLELFCLYHIYPNRFKGMATSVIFCFIYLIWVMIVAYFGDIWVYPILKILSPIPRMAFLIVCSLFGGILYVIGEILNNFIWGSSLSVIDFKKTGGKLQKSN